MKAGVVTRAPLLSRGGDPLQKPSKRQRNLGSFAWSVRLKSSLILCLAFAFLVGACKQSTARLNPAEVAFGYTDDTGSKLLMLTDDNQVLETEKAKAMVTAVCSESAEFPIRYLQFQKRTPESNGRQSAGNLKNDEGHLYEITAGLAEHGDTCLLVPSNYLRDFPIVRNDFSKEDREKRSNEYFRRLSEADARKQPLDLTPFYPADYFGKESLDRIHADKRRNSTLYWLLHRAGTSQQVAAVEFNAVGDSLLGSVVLAESDRLFFFDMPVSLKEGRERGGCWRVDDDCQLNYMGMNVPAVLGVPGERLVFFTSWGPEGQGITLFQARDGKLVELRRAYRYHSPI